MSEEKIIQHSQNAVQLLKNRSIPVRKKIVNFLEEIVIIIIAVSITLAFHNWNDLRHERELERNFLIGTREDLLEFAENIQSSVKGYQPTVDYYDTVWQQINSHRINAAYIDEHSSALINTWYFEYDASRFEGFKSSGYLRLIRNEQLLRDIMGLYSVDIPFQRDADVIVYHQRMQSFEQYIGTKARIDSSGHFHVSALLNDPAVRYQIFYYRDYLQERQNQKAHLARKLLYLADEIDKELKK